MIEMQNAETVETAETVDAPKVEKTKIVRISRKLKCQNLECGCEEAYFVPIYNKVICMNCHEIPEVDFSSETPMDYISDEVKARTAKADNTDKKMRLVYSDPTRDPMRNLPGRNDPCVCESGKKFKKCCLSTFETERNNVAREVFEEHKNKALLGVANTSKMVNAIRNYFIANPGEKEVDVSIIDFKPFKSMSGDVADINILSADARDVMAKEAETTAGE